MSSRRYGQSCSVARFLDRFGGRWTLLIVRDLLVGPRQFKDLLANMPSIGPNLLTDRLQELSARGIVEKVSAVEAGTTKYALTDTGHELETVILSMARWGLHHLADEHAENDTSRPDLLVLALRALFSAKLANGISESYEFHIGDTVFFVDVDDGKLKTGLGSAECPAFVLTSDVARFDDIANGEIDIFDAADRRLIDLQGDREALRRFTTIFSA